MWLLNRYPKLAFLTITGAVALLAQTPDADGVEYFEKNIRPVLATRCYVCHSAAAPKLQGGLQLDSRDALRKGGNSGSPITPGDPDSSLLIKALRYSDPALKMPPGKALPPEVVAHFEQWVKMGAPDPRTEAPKVTATAKRRDWWAFKAPVRPAVPEAAEASWIKTPVDNFILAKLAESKLTPAAPADKRTLIRRASYDLIGLPPTPAEIDAFTRDNTPHAFEKVVDRLLASPQYGVRWGRHWMDVARYADTADGPERFAFSYTYRDWVIRAFNEDLPFDQFARKQIAADQLTPFEKRDLAALGFITLGPQRAQGRARHDRRSHRRHHARLSRHDRDLRALPRSQVRSDSDERLLLVLRHHRQLRRARRISAAAQRGRHFTTGARVPARHAAAARRSEQLQDEAPRTTGRRIPQCTLDRALSDRCPASPEDEQRGNRSALAR